MHCNDTGEWERAHQLASRHMGADEVAVMYVNQAQVLEGQGKFKEAEKLYISVHEPDLAITMYKKQRQYDQVTVPSLFPSCLCLMVPLIISLRL